MDPDTDAALILPAELTIYTVGEQRPRWLAWAAAQAGACQVDAAAVQEIDAAGVQLLVALDRFLARRQTPVQVHAASAAWRGACATLGLPGLLAAEAAP